MPSASQRSARISWPAYDRAALLGRLRAGLQALRGVLDIRRAVLFGSWASQRATAASDIDLLIVYAGPPRDDAYALCRRLIGMRGLQPHVYTEDEYTKLASVLERMTAPGVDLLADRDP